MHGSSVIDWSEQVPQGRFWVFGYGSLMWHPDFPHTAALVARLHGYHRALCLWSWSYRGSREKPGLVLGLDRGGSCRGIAFEVAATDRVRVLDYLHDREMINSSYQPRMLAARLADDRLVPALAFVVRRDTPQYAGKLAPGRMAEVVGGAHGERGPNCDYVLNTVRHLDEMGFPCERLRVVARRLKDA